MRLFNNNISWHELPRLSTIEKHFHSLDISLNTSLRDYESFDLINKESLNHKYQLLKDVITKLEGLKKRKTYDKWIYNNLFEIAIKRKKYLSILFDPLYSKNLPVEDQFKEFKPTIIIHLAAIHFIPYCNLHPQQTLDVNTLGTYYITQLSCQFKVKQIIFASSASIYGDRRKLCKEDDLPMPKCIYGYSKFLAKQTITTLSKIP